jgi:hypothetical protein
MKKYLFLTIALLCAVAQGAKAEFITNIVVVGDDDSGDADDLYEKYTKAGWIGCDQDLNDGVGGHYIYLVFQKGNSGTPITHLYLYSGANPGPDTYQGSNWHDTSDTSEENDNGGVHTNSGVQNKWYYLLTDGGEGTNDNGDSYNIEGIGIERSRMIAYLTLTSYATRQSNYAAIRKASLEAAEVLFGANSVECQTVARAWDAVGVSESIQGIVDGISPIAVNSNKSSQVYDLQGRMVNNQPTTPGIYIKDGKKMVIK